MYIDIGTWKNALILAKPCFRENTIFFRSNNCTEKIINLVYVYSMNPSLYTVQGSCSSLKAVMLAVQSLQLGDTRYTSPIPIDNPHQSRHYVYIRMEGISGGTTVQLVSFILSRNFCQ